VPRRWWTRWPVLLLAAILVAAAGVAVALSTSGGGRPNRFKPGSDVPVHIPASGGVRLAAEVVTPEGSGPAPLVVMPASWGAQASEYRLVAERFAAAGFEVVSYAQRGFGGSGGTIDLAGVATQQDVGTVVDWALAHTRADARHVGALGVSYGAAVSLLAAARDARIRAVVALSGWADLAGALVPNGTPDLPALHGLFDDPLAAGKLTGAAQSSARTALQRPASASDAIGKISASRSATGSLAALNRNRPAIMLAGCYADSILDPAQLVSFYEELHTPKRLQLSPGDHTGPEISGLQGRADVTFDDALAWLRHYLAGGAPTSGSPVQLQDALTGAWHGYPAWPRDTATLRLGVPGTAGNLDGASSTWQQRLVTGTDSSATTGPSYLASPLAYRPPTVAASSIDPAHALVWTSASAPRAARLSGAPLLRLQVTASTACTTFFGYLYDVAPGGTATLVTYVADTVRSGAVAVPLRPMSWTFAAGHRVLLVVDTVDPRYAAAEPSGSTITFASSAAHPATLTVSPG
jgi:predicted acyl esterase